MKNFGYALVLIALLLAAPNIWAQNIPNLPAGEVKNLLDQKQHVLIVDTRTTEEYARGHLPTAINIPPQQFSAIQIHLPQDRSIPLIFYCRGYT
ncbi:rhodanese-like domain-containing protein [Geoalkalibacter halelectricus]|uniref:Rhodanese-like domain-containing protein n=1 Tax=Geoalkalibacter halelectricus TaxID=2847045 RepID=A0ABY5ZMD3_9BACT|nr:rhodanese-like domain-containing protein [Geoalkalibacter halelectricus]MDO3376832.1 rhodanese-like domain-containing protein [Geoalkalibacter halelectricus]UWZ79102.1 rhodanese-like domain-containing protein [Geoalkalibacter halelectricus]